jgi:ribosomal protein L37AE/L43A
MEGTAMLQALECPKCSKKAVVQRTSDLYLCLSCDFKRDLSKSAPSKPDNDLSLMLMTLMLALLVALIIL